MLVNLSKRLPNVGLIAIEQHLQELIVLLLSKLPVVCTQLQLLTVLKPSIHDLPHILLASNLIEETHVVILILQLIIISFILIFINWLVDPSYKLWHLLEQTLIGIK